MREIGYYNPLRSLDYRAINGFYFEQSNDPLYSQDYDLKDLAVDITHPNRSYDTVSDGLVGNEVWLDSENFSGTGIHLEGHGKHMKLKMNTNGITTYSGIYGGASGGMGYKYGAGLSLAGGAYYDESPKKGSGVSLAGGADKCKTCKKGSGLVLAGVKGGGKKKIVSMSADPTTTFKIGALKKLPPAAKLKKKLLKDDKKLKALLTKLTHSK